MNNNDDFKVEVQKLEYLYANLLTSMVGAFLIAILTYVAIVDNVDKEILNIWIFSILVLTLFRLFSYKIYKNETITSQNISKYFKLFFYSLFLSSLLWAMLPILLFPKEMEYQVFMFLMFLGLSTGAMVSLAVKHDYYLSFLLFSMLPMLIVIYLEDTRISQFVSIAGLLYILYLLVVSKKISLKIIENISLLHSNEKLINTLKKKADEANSANKAKSKFLSVMSHEIRTPLNAIIGFVKILIDTETNSIKKRYLDTIDSSSYLLMNVINDVLDISKIESGSFSVEIVSYEPYTELYQLYVLYERSASENDIRMINSISMDMPIFLKGDILRLKQIVSNLLSNAIKFTPKGKTIELIINYEQNKSTLYVEVKDTGIGIEKHNLEKITKEFTQADDSTARKYGGTGLGLSIVTKLLSLQDSKLEIKSEYGYGSSFYFRLPVLLSTRKKEELDENVIYKFSDKKVLVAEDNKTNQLLIRLILEGMDIEVVIANDGQEAEDMMLEDEFDLILMDINMPNKNGSEAMFAIKKFNEDIAIIALTANAVSGDREKYINEGFDDYIAKPIDNNELLLVLKKYLPISPT